MNHHLKAIIIDDEENGRNFLKNMLAEFCPEVFLADMASNIQDGAIAIAQHAPDVVFLDIQMPFGTGFDLLEQLGEVDFEVVFTTAYDNYALRAIKFAALDYLLKPIDIEELKCAVNKAVNKRRQPSNSVDQMRHLMQMLQQGDRPPEKIALPSGEGLIFVKISDILRCEADGAYTHVHVKEIAPILVSKNLKGIENLLKGHPFYRVHHGHLIHLDYVKKYFRGRGGQVEMEDGSVVDVSVRRKDGFLKALQGSSRYHV